MRLTVTQLRIAMLALNFLLTLIIGAQAIYGVVHQPETPIPLREPLVAADLEYHDGRTVSASNIMPRVHQFGPRIVAPPAPPLPTPTAGTDKPPDPIPEPGELLPGPLEATWEYVHCIIDPVDPSASRATLQKKDAGGGMPAPGRKITTRSQRVIKSGSTGNRPPRASTAPGLPTVPADRKTFRPKEEWKEEAEGIDICVLEVTRARFVYHDHKQPGRTFALVRKQNNIYQEGPNGTSTLKKSPETEDPANPALADGERKQNFHFQAPDRDKDFEERHIRTPAGGLQPLQPSATKVPAPNASHAANQPEGRPKSQEEQLREIRELQGNLQKSPEYLKASKADRDKLDKLLGGKK